MSNPDRASIIARLDIALRAASAQGLLVSQAVADKIGLGTTDLECLDLIQLRGPLSAGDLARATGLTSGAVTGLIDRLERAGYVMRTNDPTDRRKVLVRVRPENIGPIIALYQPMQESMNRLCAGYTEAELELIAGFTERGLEVGREQVARIRGT